MKVSGRMCGKNFWTRVVYAIFHTVFWMLFFSKKDREEMIHNVYSVEENFTKYDSRIKELFLASSTFMLAFVASGLFLCLPFISLTFVFGWVDYIHLPLFSINLPLLILYTLYGLKELHIKKLKKKNTEINFDSFSTKIHNLDMLFFIIPAIISLWVILYMGTR